MKNQTKAIAAKGYSSTSNLTKSVCEELDFTFSINFVETLKRGKKIFVRGTCGKENEFRALKKACSEAGYTYKGLFA